jgi:hypothetical protein
MTEAEWLTCREPLRMLEAVRGTASERKLRLFALACYRRVWHRLGEARRKVIEVAERYAERMPHRRDLGDEDAGWLAGMRYYVDSAFAAACHASEATCWLLVDHVRWQGKTTRDSLQEATLAERPHQSNLLRCLFGNPFRPYALDPSWLTWAGGTIAQLVQVIHDERRFADLPILADALEDAGCTGLELVAHLRSSGDHARGCWALDLLRNTK